MVRLQAGSPQGVPDDGTDSAGTGKTTMGCPVADKNTPRCARRATLSQIGGDRLSDVVRERKLVTITSLATHREYASPPIDIIEFQGEHFARAVPNGPAAAGSRNRDNRPRCSDRKPG